MFYRLLKQLFFYTVRGYFRNVTIKGSEYIKDNEAVIFVSNHNSAFMDPIAFAVNTRRKLYFLARGESFKSPVARFFYKQVNMIPIYRPETSPGEVHKNKEVFELCYNHLARKKCLLIYPEGNMKTERRLRPLKSGTARIALSAEQAYHFNLGLKIIPVGINYSNPHRFQSDLFINIGAPIEVSAYRENFEKDPKKAINKLTADIETAMREQLIVIENESLETLISRIEHIYRVEFSRDKSRKDNAVAEFKLSKEIVDAVHYFQRKDEDRVWRMNLLLQQYFFKLERFKLTDELLGGGDNVRFSFQKKAIFFTFGFPIFLLGFINNFIPFKIVAALIKRIKANADFEGSLKLTLGGFVFLISYVISAFVMAHFTNIWLGIIYFLVLYPTGLFALHYLKEYLMVKGTLRYLATIARNGKLVNKLIHDRAEIIRELEAGREEYLANRPSEKPQQPNGHS